MLFTVIGIGVICYVLFYFVLLCLLDCDIPLAFYEKFGKHINSLHGKVVFITGASSGIGQHTAIVLAKHGVKLVLAARRKNELDHVKQLCLESSGGKLAANDVLIIVMDVLNFESHENYFKLAVQHFGHVDILLNNAGRSQRALWENIDLSVDRAILDLNLFAVINLSKIAVKYFKTRGQGHIAITSSVAGLIGVPFSASYTGSKYAVHGYFNSLRLEKLGTDLDLTVTIICPGPTFTNFLQESFTDTPGIKYGISASSTDRRMTGERCGQLVAVSLANKLSESWMGIFPLMPFLYIYVYCPVLTQILVKVVGPKKLFRLRDGQEIKLNEAKKEQ